MHFFRHRLKLLLYSDLTVLFLVVNDLFCKRTKSFFVIAHGIIRYIAKLSRDLKNEFFIFFLEL